jgi:hypothetical protein
MLSMNCLSQEDLTFYRENGYLILRGVVPESLLNGVQIPIQKWVDSKIEEWQQAGLIDRDFQEYPFDTRLMHAWNAAGKPSHSPNPTRELVSREMFAVLRFPYFIQLAQALFDTQNIRVLKIFHCRPDLPDQPFTDTPWHQDAQCCPSLRGSNFAVMWMPLMDVDEHNGCLQMAAGQGKDGLYKVYKDPIGHYICMRPEDAAELKNIETIRMRRGDLLVFNQVVPHRAVPNYSDAIRWAVDIRYAGEAVPGDTSFVFEDALTCAHEDASLIEHSYEQWCEIMRK